MMGIGIMQGRLLPPLEGKIQSFPRERWRDEFRLAAAAGLAAIEWIYDVAGCEENPIVTDRGIAEMKTLGAQHGVEVRSLCADYFMDLPLLRADAPQVEERTEVLMWLLGRCSRAGIDRIVLPFVDSSQITTDAELLIVVGILDRVLPVANTAGVELHLETSLDPVRFARLLALLPHPEIKVNYDSGNSASLGFAPAIEFREYGHRVGSIHMKDRVKGGTTVPLGIGDADFPSLFRCLRDIAYHGDIVLQVARGTDGDEVEWSRQNLEYVRDLQRRSDAPWT